MIARSGQSGNASGPHLHFEVRLEGRPVSPVTAMTGNSITVSVKGAESTFKVEAATQLIARGAGRGRPRPYVFLGEQPEQGQIRRR